MSSFQQPSFLCPSCASTQGKKEGNQIKCIYCGNKYRANLMDEPLFVQLQIALNERQEARFDEARRHYDKMLREYPEDASLEEVYWGRFLCEQYVIFYQNEFGESIPSFWEINREPCAKSKSYQKALEYGRASGNAENYERLAALIEDYKGKYERVKKEFPRGSQIFICFKDSGTNDRNLGYEIYNRFSGKYNIFFSPQSLNQIRGNDYEPYIYHALKTAKVLIVLCSSRDALESKWVHNEWWRFHHFADGADRTIIPIFRDGFDASMLPQEIKNCQGHQENVQLIATLGERLEIIFGKEDTPAAAVPPPPKKKKGKGIVLLSLLLLLLIGGGTALGLSLLGEPDTPPTTVITSSEGLKYVLLSDDTYEVTGIGSCTDTDIVIPAIYNEKAVTSIGEEAFSDCGTLSSITVSDSVMRIGNRAFYSCTSLKRITISNSVTSIGDEAFIACERLSSIVVEEENPVYHSKNNCLIETESMTLVLGCQNSVIPTDDSVTRIGVDAFSYCKGLTSITVPDSVTSIGDRAFYNCMSLKSITIPNSVTSIGDEAFSWCGRLPSITIPGSVTSIGYGAFYGCTDLTRITIPESVTSIGEYAFSGCTDLSSIAVDEENLVYHSENNCLIETERKTLIWGCEASVIPTDGSVTIIGDHAFADCPSLSDITIPEGVTSIGEYAFPRCTSLSNITIPESVTSIGEYAFFGCTSLSSVTFAENSQLTSIGDYAFSDCTSLVSLTIPGSVTSIGEDTFSGCSNLSSITFEETDAEPEETDAEPEETNAEPEETDAEPEETDAEPEETDPEETESDPIDLIFDVFE